jgi:hypothetical protein
MIPPKQNQLPTTWHRQPIIKPKIMLGNPSMMESL